MNEQERANRLSADVDHLLHGEAVSNSGSEDGGLLYIAQDLAQADFSSDSAIREMLRNQLLDRAAGQQGAKFVNRKKIRWGRALAIAAALLIILTIATLTIPPLRALAQEVLVQIGFLIFTDEETTFQRYLQGTPIPTSVPIPADQLPPKPISGLPAYLPEYIPDGYMLDAKSSNNEDAIYTKGEAGKSLINVQYILEIQQQSSEHESLPFPVSDAKVVQLTVHGQAGVWIEQAPVGAQVAADGGLKPLKINMLVWEENGLLFIITNLVAAADNADYPLLTLDELLKVAESLAPTK